MVSTVNVDAADLEEVLDKSINKKRPYYTKFTDEENVQWDFDGILPGRGQDGLAAFYKNSVTGEEILIKVDDAATCALEGTAYFARDAAGVVPSGLKESAIFGTAGTMVVRTPGETNKELVLSIQPKAKKFKSWDKLVYGKKRDPKTLRSYESMYHDKIEDAIASLPQKVQWQLAAGIKISGVCGDESLHVGQFVALLDDDDNITGIQRIDFGARERYAVSRNNTSEEITPYSTSREYSSSGQLGKNYVSYLTSQPEIAQKYTVLWSREFDAGDLFEKSKDTFITQINNLPSSERRNAVLEAIKTMNKGIKNDSEKFVIPERTPTSTLIELVASKLAVLDTSRAVNMRNKAVEELTKRVTHVQELGLINATEKDEIIELLTRNPVGLEAAKELVDEAFNKMVAMNEKRTTASPTENIVLDELQSLIVDTIDYHAIDNELTKDQKARLTDDIERVRALRQLGDYYQHLLSVKQTPKCLAKQELVAGKMSEIRSGLELSEVFTEEFSELISANRNVFGKQSHGAVLMGHLNTLLSHRDSIDPAPGSDMFPGVDEVGVLEPIPEGRNLGLGLEDDLGPNPVGTPQMLAARKADATRKIIESVTPVASRRCTPSPSVVRATSTRPPGRTQ